LIARASRRRDALVHETPEFKKHTMKQGFLSLRYRLPECVWPTNFADDLRRKLRRVLAAVRVLLVRNNFAQTMLNKPLEQRKSIKIERIAARRFG
jgi:hypothetical protein